MKKNTVLAAVAVVLVALFALVAKGCEAMAGGRVGTTDEFRAHVRATTEAGTSVYLALSPAPVGDLYPAKESGRSCADDFGWDDGDVTRDRPAYSWDLEYASTADFRAALKALEATWRAEGREVEKVENGIATTLDDGIRVTFHLGWYSDEPELRAEGRCMRYTDAYGDAYDFQDDDNGDGTVDEYEKPAW
ncbi:hypothetical protein STRCI_003122 [Streptomyces cinnabarinus]|uniref:Lipoprotein n=1 Tax=Streptomyces cinnabarinus TaxID=67287 RepID=A0ABY7KBN3_9ACTN|nr:hypothetical protein [Streptomyces cinnabarinus]WAZ21917.1 hypothetical protein STRCI_003122 [Streptomyces cinnabarinus]